MIGGGFLLQKKAYCVLRKGCAYLRGENQSYREKKLPSRTPEGGDMPGKGVKNDLSKKKKN